MIVVFRAMLPPASQPFFQDGDVGHPVVLGQEVRRRQAVPAAADNDGVVRGLGLGVPPKEIRVFRELVRAHCAAPIMSDSNAAIWVPSFWERCG